MKQWLSTILYLIDLSAVTIDQELIQTSGNKGLCQVVKKLTVERPVQSLPSHTSQSKLSQDFLEFCGDKISNLRTPLENLPPPTFAFTNIPASNVMQSFQPVSEDDILKLVKLTEIKLCTLDPIPAPVFRECLTVLLPAIADIINQSLRTRVFPTSFKSALADYHEAKPWPWLSSTLTPNLQPFLCQQGVGACCVPTTSEASSWKLSLGIKAICLQAFIQCRDSIDEDPEWPAPIAWRRKWGNPCSLGPENCFRHLGPRKAS